MGKQLITIGTDGSVSGLRHKRGSGVDLRDLGNVAVRRVTDIRFDSKRQQYYPVFLDLEMASALQDRVLYFDDYEDAVTHEVELIQGYLLGS